MSEELKPCPHCGSEAEFFVHNNFGEDYKTLIIDCKECFACMELMIDAYTSAEDFEKAKKELFEAWNRRIERTAKVETYTDDQQETWRVCECGTDVLKIFNYCPECGAKLDWSGNE